MSFAMRRTSASGTGSGYHRHARGDSHLPRRGLAAHQANRLGRGPDEGETRVTARGGEVLVFGKESVARVNGIGAGLPGHLDDPLDAEVTLARRIRTHQVRLVRHPHMKGSPIALGIDGDGRNPHVATGADDPDRDLAAVRDKNLFHQPETLLILALRYTRAARTAAPPAMSSQADKRRARAQTPTRSEHVLPYSGMFPCFFGGFLSRLPSRVASA
jgi:hypothetical protein